MTKKVLVKWGLRTLLTGVVLVVLTACSLVIPEGKYWVTKHDYRGNRINCEYQDFLHLDFPLGYGGQGQWVEHRLIAGPSACG